MTPQMTALPAQTTTLDLCPNTFIKPSPEIGNNCGTRAHSTAWAPSCETCQPRTVPEESPTSNKQQSSSAASHKADVKGA